MKDIWMLAMTFHCKIDHVDTTAAASSLRCQRHRETHTRMEEDGKHQSDGGSENKERRRGY